MISEQEKELAEKVIRSHDGINYNLLREISLPSPAEDSDNTITEEMYNEMCEDISTELGHLSGIEFIDCLQRRNSRLSLWKASYASSDDEVFWGIAFDHETLKVTDVHVDW